MHDCCHASHLRKVEITRSRNRMLCTRGKSLPAHWVSRLPAQSDAAAAAMGHQRTIKRSSKPAGSRSVICLIMHETCWQAPFQPTLHDMVCYNCFIDRLGVYSGRVVGGGRVAEAQEPAYRARSRPGNPARMVSPKSANMQTERGGEVWDLVVTASYERF